MSGFDGVGQGVTAAEARRVDYPKDTRFQLREAGDWAIVRFMHQGDEFQWTYCHTLPPENGRPWGNLTPCFAGKEHEPNASCLLCQRGDLKRSLRGFMPLIWRQAPVFKRDGQGKVMKDQTGKYIVDGHADQVAVWSNINLEISSQLGSKDQAWKGLRSRDAKIQRYGVKPKVGYNIEPADFDAGATLLSEADQALWNSNVPDLTLYLKPLPAATLYAKLGMGQAVEAGQQVDAAAAAKQDDFSAFMQ